LSEDRRQSLDRRDHRLGGRRITDVEPDHGTRARYQTRSCRCTPCRAANALYEADRARDKAAGTVRMGTVISGAEAQKRIRQMKAEKISGRAINRQNGLKDHAFVLHPSGVTWRKLLRIRRIYRLHMLENRERPNEAGSEG
jgi:hypothetical protein